MCYHYFLHREKKPVPDSVLTMRPWVQIPEISVSFFYPLYLFYLNHKTYLESKKFSFFMQTNQESSHVVCVLRIESLSCRGGSKSAVVRRVGTCAPAICYPSVELRDIPLPADLSLLHRRNALTCPASKVFRSTGPDAVSASFSAHEYLHDCRAPMGPSPRSSACFPSCSSFFLSPAILI